MGLEDRAARGLGRMRGQDELDAKPGTRLLECLFADPRAVEVREGVGEGFPWHAPLGLVLATPADAVVLFGDVDELKEEREGALHRGLALETERGDRLAERDT